MTFIELNSRQKVRKIFVFSSVMYGTELNIYFKDYNVDIR